MTRLLPALGPLVLLALLTGLTSTSLAAEPSAEAKRLSNSAAADFKAGRFPEAEEKWDAAYKAGADPFVLYMLARCYQLDGKPDKALEAYRAFLDKVPRTNKRAEVQKQIKELERQVATAAPKPAETPKEEPAAATAQPAANPAEPVPAVAVTPAPQLAPAPAPSAPKRFDWLNKGMVKKWWFWTAVGGVVVAGAAIGIGVGLGTRTSPTFPEVGPGISSALGVRF